QEELADRQPRLDRLAQTHLVGDQEALREAGDDRVAHPRLVRPGLDGRRRGAEPLGAGQERGIAQVLDEDPRPLVVVRPRADDVDHTLLFDASRHWVRLERITGGRLLRAEVDQPLADGAGDRERDPVSLRALPEPLEALDYLGQVWR